VTSHEDDVVAATATPRTTQLPAGAPLQPLPLPVLGDPTLREADSRAGLCVDGVCRLPG